MHALYRSNRRRFDTSILVSLFVTMFGGALAQEVAGFAVGWTYLVAAFLFVVFLIVRWVGVRSTYVPPSVSDNLKPLLAKFDGDVWQVAEFLVKPPSVSDDLKPLLAEFDGDVLQVAEFLVKVFRRGMPPAFVKHWDPQHGGRLVLESRALDPFRPESERRLAMSKRRREIKADHAAGDDAAANGAMHRQVEIPDVLDQYIEPTVLTTKTSLTHEDGTFIVGWFVPVRVAEDARDRETICARERRGQVLHSIIEDDAHSEDAVLIEVAPAVRSMPKRATYDERDR